MFFFVVVLGAASCEMPWWTGRLGYSPWRWRRASTKEWEIQTSDANLQSTQTGSLLKVPKAVATENTQQGEIHFAKGLLHLAQWCLGLTWGFYVRFCLLCMHDCLSVCEPLISTKHMALNRGETAAGWFSFTASLYGGLMGATFRFGTECTF